MRLSGRFNRRNRYEWSALKERRMPYLEIMKLTPGGGTLGATVAGLDLSQPLQADLLAAVLRALGRYGVLRFPAQTLTATELKAFSAQLGGLEINVAGGFQEPGIVEVMILSNLVENSSCSVKKRSARHRF